jgi:hypothetical protein
VSADSQLLHHDALSSGDVGPGWTVTGTETADHPSSMSVCAPGEQLAPFTARLDEDLSYDLHRDGSEAGHLWLAVSTSPTAADVSERVRKVERRADFEECVRQGAIADERSAYGRGGSIESASISPLEHPAIVSVTNAYRTVLHYHFAGQAKIGFIDQFFIARGRSSAEISFRTCCLPFAPTLEFGIVNNFDARLNRDFATKRPAT